VYERMYMCMLIDVYLYVSMSMYMHICPELSVVQCSAVQCVALPCRLLQHPIRTPQYLMSQRKFCLVDS